MPRAGTALIDRVRVYIVGVTRKPACRCIRIVVVSDYANVVQAIIGAVPRLVLVAGVELIEDQATIGFPSTSNRVVCGTIPPAGAATWNEPHTRIPPVEELPGLIAESIVALWMAVEVDTVGANELGAAIVGLSRSPCQPLVG